MDGGLARSADFRIRRRMAAPLRRSPKRSEDGEKGLHRPVLFFRSGELAGAPSARGGLRPFLRTRRAGPIAMILASSTMDPLMYGMVISSEAPSPSSGSVRNGGPERNPVQGLCGKYGFSVHRRPAVRKGPVPSLRATVQFCSSAPSPFKSFARRVRARLSREDTVPSEISSIMEISDTPYP